MIGSSCRAAEAELPRQALGCQSRSLGSFLWAHKFPLVGAAGVCWISESLSVTHGYVGCRDAATCEGDTLQKSEELGSPTSHMSHFWLCWIVHAIPCSSMLFPVCIFLTGWGLLVSPGETTNGPSFYLSLEPGRKEGRSPSRAGSWPLRYLNEMPYMMLVQLAAWTWPWCCLRKRLEPCTSATSRDAHLWPSLSWMDTLCWLRISFTEGLWWIKMTALETVHCTMPWPMAGKTLPSSWWIVATTQTCKTNGATLQWMCRCWRAMLLWLPGTWQSAQSSLIPPSSFHSKNEKACNSILSLSVLYT